MQRLMAGLMVAVIGMSALAAVGCVDEAKYNAVLLANREQAKQIQEKEAQMAAMNERVSALQARSGDVQRMLQEKDDHLATVMRERDTLRKAFNELMAAYTKLSERPVAPNVGPLPAEVDILLKKLAAEYPGLVIYDPATGTLRFASDVTFDSGSNKVKPDAQAAIGKLAVILASVDGKPVRARIVGHTDRDPVKKPQTIALLQELKKAANNQGLSEARAESVAEILVAGGVDKPRISTQGVGDSQPLDNAATADAKAKNRRVEIFLSM